MAEVVGRSLIAPYMAKFESMRIERTPFDRKWQMVSDYILTRRDFSVTQRPNQLRPHRVVSSVGTNNNTRMAAFLLAYLVDYSRPFMLPNVKRGLVAAGRPTDLQADSLDYLGDLEYSIYDRMMLPKAMLMQRLGAMLKEFCAFGCGVIWTGRRRGFGPYYNGRPVQACWWSENEEGEIDTLYFKLKLPLYRVFQRWPRALKLDGWKDLSDAAKASEQELTDIILVCEPRIGGRVGAVAEAKPFKFLAIAEEKGAILETSGYNSFPYSVFRYDPMPGAAYAEGAGCQVVSDVMVANHLQQAIENCAEQKAQPALAVPARMFGAKLDRRPGALNSYNPAGLGLQRADQAILKMDFTGDPTECIKLLEMLTENIEIGYFTDWMRLPDRDGMTATEIDDRRDTRLRGAASIVANCELPMSILGDRTQEALAEEGMIAPPPPDLAGADVDWEYAGPLAVAQLRGNVQSVLKLMDAQALVSKLDPQRGLDVDLGEGLRAVAEGLATPTHLMRSRADVAAETAAKQHQAQQQAAAEKLATVAQAARDGGQGVAAMAGAGADAGAGAAGGAAQPFAPAAPFALPMAA